MLTGSLPSSSLLYKAQEVTKLTLHVDSSLKSRTIGIVCGAEGALWLNPVPEPQGETELLFILWRAQDGAWHRTQNQQAVRGHHAYSNMCMCAYTPAYGHVCSLPCQSPRMPTHQLAVTEPSMKCLGSDQIRQPVLLAFAASQRGEVKCCASEL